jgi:hypothetical protein
MTHHSGMDVNICGWLRPVSLQRAVARAQDPPAATTCTVTVSLFNSVGTSPLTTTSSRL